MLIGEEMSIMATRGLFSVYIGNLDKSTTLTELSDLFKKFGSPRRLYIADKTGPHTYGFVRFVRQDSARDAIMEMHGTLWKGRKLEVELSSESPCVNSINKEIKDIREGRKNAQSDAVATAKAEKLLALKIAIKDFNQTVKNGSELDAIRLISELNKVPVKILPSQEDSFTFNGSSYLAELKAAHKNPQLRRNERITPLQQSEELLALQLPWVVELQQAPNINSSFSQKVEAQSVRDDKISSRPSYTSLGQSSSPSYNSSQQSAISPPVKPVLQSSPPIPVVSAKSISLMPDLVIDHQSTTSGYSSGSSADEMIVGQNDSFPRKPPTARGSPANKATPRTYANQKQQARAADASSSIRKAAPVIPDPMHTLIVSKSAPVRISASERIKCSHLQRVQNIQAPEEQQWRSSNQVPPLQHLQINQSTRRKPLSSLHQPLDRSKVGTSVVGAGGRTGSLRVTASNGRGKQLLASLSK
ncbi:uncharacterized protein [Watersipora subatra]|uniref:uncharacterized protein isoform X2 n=1 Tax=Watersipora subatra TaxID=2589382 RepID=UPI00355C2FEF